MKLIFQLGEEPEYVFETDTGIGTVDALTEEIDKLETYYLIPETPLYWQTVFVIGALKGIRETFIEFEAELIELELKSSVCSSMVE